MSKTSERIITTILICMWLACVGTVIHAITVEDAAWAQYTQQHNCYLVETTISATGRKGSATVCPK